MRIRVVVTGRSYQLADDVPAELELSAEATVQQAIDQINTHLADGAELPGSCLVAVSGRHLGRIADGPQHALRDGDELVLVAPVAGG